MLDVIFRGGLIVNGRGGPPRRGHVGVLGGRVVAVGSVDESARRVVDADGLVVAPGFIDPHVHYDAQVMWDPDLLPSARQGVTTVVGGNCGFGVAPMDETSASYLLPMLARVEGMPLTTLESCGVDWSGWRTFGEWIAALRGRLALNAGFLVGHSTVRRIVMGEAAVGSEATPDQAAAMAALVDEALDAGALGFSTSLAENHCDADGNPVPSRHADLEELHLLAGRLRTRPGTVLQLVPTLTAGFGDDERDALVSLAVAAGRPLLWNALLVDGSNPAYHESLLATSPLARSRGASVVALAIPGLSRFRLSLSSALVFEAMPRWASMLSLPHRERLDALRAAARRAELVADLDEVARGPDGPLRRLTRVQDMRIGEATLPEHRRLNGRTIGEVAAERGQAPTDILFDLAVAEDLAVGFWPPPIGDDEASWRQRARVWARSDVLLGGGDAGAHLDAIDGFAGCPAFVADCLRGRKLFPLETAIRLVTSAPAEMLGLSGRGTIAPGAHADLIAFDPATFGPGPLELRHDLPAGAPRLYSEATGLHHVLVNGVPLIAQGEPTGALAGDVLRAGATA